MRGIAAIRAFFPQLSSEELKASERLTLEERNSQRESERLSLQSRPSLPAADVSRQHRSSAAASAQFRPGWRQRVISSITPDLIEKVAS